MTILCAPLAKIAIREFASPPVTPTSAKFAPEGSAQTTAQDARSATGQVPALTIQKTALTATPVFQPLATMTARVVRIAIQALVSRVAKLANRALEGLVITVAQVANRALEEAVKTMTQNVQLVIHVFRGLASTIVMAVQVVSGVLVSRLVLVARSAKGLLARITAFQKTVKIALTGIAITVVRHARGAIRAFAMTHAILTKTANIAKMGHAKVTAPIVPLDATKDNVRENVTTKPVRSARIQVVSIPVLQTAKPATTKVHATGGAIRGNVRPVLTEIAKTTAPRPVRPVSREVAQEMDVTPVSVSPVMGTVTVPMTALQAVRPALMDHAKEAHAIQKTVKVALMGSVFPAGETSARLAWTPNVSRLNVTQITANHATPKVDVTTPALGAKVASINLVRLGATKKTASPVLMTNVSGVMPRTANPASTPRANQHVVRKTAKVASIVHASHVVGTHANTAIPSKVVSRSHVQEVVTPVSVEAVLPAEGMPVRPVMTEIVNRLIADRVRGAILKQDAIQPVHLANPASTILAPTPVTQITAKDATMVRVWDATQMLAKVA